MLPSVLLLNKQVDAIVPRNIQDRTLSLSGHYKPSKAHLDVFNSEPSLALVPLHVLIPLQQWEMSLDLNQRLQKLSRVHHQESLFPSRLHLMILLKQLVEEDLQICHPVQPTHHQQVVLRSAIGLEPFLSLKQVLVCCVHRIKLHFAAFPYI